MEFDRGKFLVFSAQEMETDRARGGDVEALELFLKLVCSNFTFIVQRCLQGPRMEKSLISRKKIGKIGKFGRENNS